MADDDGRGTGTVPASVVLAMGMPTTKEDELLCEGYLKKIRGFAQNRRRWFRVTANHIAFFSADGGSLISYIHRDHVSDVRDISKYRFLISTHKPFGASGASSMILEASTPEAKNRWLLCLQKTTDSSRGTQEDTGHLYTEGYMCKLQGFGSRDRTRWFVLTDRYFSYYTTEAGDLMGRCPIEQIQSVKPIQDHT
ncbi:hypothetical protein PTSG_10374 [Salpingoeca rosetta]|uniref:PH domain-containing protein n=1 Tax=Salpingoeca rosetta (strain ATCC 50818 / BSB-021) TaxID=946362 RepID=F2UR46_SALR5|nr:uncharacterized protein PTSG_10374 [Salpingoeca rosetta]EGD80101.1 hypothetical protein PTSG_10374 [Salpingoeca rosetta]|eukprot:XP_004988426.1 hypothetical protein PTSG_10374 [Salpingoeca rosetta]